MKKRVEFLLVPLFMVLLLAGCQKPPETAESVVQKIIAAHGTEKALREAQGFLFHGHIQAIINNDHGKLWILYRRPAQLRVIVQLEKSKEDRLYLHGTGWRDSGKGFIEVADAPLEVMKFQADHLDLPFGLLEGKYKAELLNEIVPDKPAKLMLTDSDGVHTTITVDPVRWVVRTVERDFLVKGQKARLGVVYEEYRTIKGVQLPFRILNYVNGQGVGQTDFQSVQTNPSLPETVFSTPGSEAE